MAAPSQEEKKLLKQFRSQLLDLQLTEDQSSDMYLLRWIRAREHKLDKAEEMLRKSLKWREQYGADSLLTWEPPTTVTELMPFEATANDKNNRPVLFLAFGNWKVRNLVDLGYKDESIRNFCKFLELVLMRMKGKVTKEGVPVTQAIIVADVEGFQMKAMGSLAVLDAFKEMAHIMEANYPEIVYKGMQINGPKIFQVLWTVLKPLMSKETYRKTQFLSSPSKWKPVLLEAIDVNQLPEYFGGSRDSSLHAVYKYTMKSKAQDSFKGVTVAAGDVLKIPVEVSSENSWINWDITVEYYDVEFFVTFEDKIVLSKQKIDSCRTAVVGRLNCKDAGTYVLNFDNSYSKLRSKSLKYFVKVVDGAELKE